MPPQLYDRISAMEAALRNLDEMDISVGKPNANPNVSSNTNSSTHTPGTRTPTRHSLDHRFDKPAPEVDAAPAPTPAQEKGNPFDALSPTSSDAKKPFYDSIAAAYGLGIRDEDDFLEYTVYDAFVTNLRVCPVHMNEGGRYYYVEHRSFLPHVPGVILREGTEKTGKCLGAAHIPLQGVNTFGLGDFTNNPASIRWEKFAHKSFWTHMRYHFTIELADGKRRSFNWVRTRNNIIDDQGDLVLVEEGNESNILAEYLGKGLLKWKKRGRLRIREMEAYGEEWELTVLLTWASVIELSRRRARIRRYSPTHFIGI